MSGNTLPVKKSKRLLNVELLRILSMFFIVCNHFLGHGLCLQDYDMTDSNRFILWFLRGICYMGTNLFILISAYFQCRSHFKSKSILLLIAQVLFYSIVLYIISLLCGLTQFSYSSLISVVLPILSSSYWFVTCYVGLYLLAPFLNKLIASMSRRQLLSLLLVLFIFFSVVPTIFFNSTWLNWGGSSGIVWFIFLYFVAGYIRYYVDVESISTKKLLSVLIIFLLLPLLTKIIIANISLHFTGRVIGSSLFFVKNSIILFPMSVFFFLAFMKIKVSGRFAERFIEFIASSMFAVYLISENMFLRESLWTYCQQIVENTPSMIPLYVIAIPVAIMVVCILIDQIRKFVFWLLAKTGIPQKIEGFVSKYTGKLYSDL